MCPGAAAGKVTNFTLSWTHPGRTPTAPGLVVEKGMRSGPK